MKLQFVHANGVIVANQFNPSIISQLWLVMNGIAAEADFREDCVFMPMLAQVQAREFVLLVVPDQLQFVPRQQVLNDQELALEKVGGITKMLPHTPFTAIGVNFHWHAAPRQGEFGPFTRGLFLRDDNPLFEDFGVADARFGAYMSRNALGCRLKLDIKPLTVKVHDQSTEVLQFAFNFHRDLNPETAGTEMEEVLRRWTDAKRLATTLLERVELWQNS